MNGTTWPRGFHLISELYRITQPEDPEFKSHPMQSAESMIGTVCRLRSPVKMGLDQCCGARQDLLGAEPRRI